MSVGRVYLVGAGPGDPGLITVRGVECLRLADVVLYDDLANPGLLDHVSDRCERVYVGKRRGFKALEQGETNQLLVDRAREGKHVVRLKGGDPYVFGRGGEEALVLQEHGIPFEVVPGITSGFAAPAYAGIPVTHRGVATQVTLVTGHEDPMKPNAQVDWQALGKAGGTVVVYMGVGKRAQYAQCLIEGGRAPDTPVAAIQWGTRPEQRVVRGTLDRLEDLEISNPAAIVIGEVAAFDLAWFERRPLAGRTIAVTRTRAQASKLVRDLREHGAEVLEVPTIEIADPADFGPVDQAIDRISDFTWLLFASPNAVDRFLGRLVERKGDIRALGPVKIATIGPATAKAVERFGVAVDLIPDHHASSGLAHALRDIPDVSSQRVLIPKPEVAKSEAPDVLRELGAQVQECVVYRTVRPAQISPVALDRFRDQGVDMVTFTSSSTVRHFHELLDTADFEKVRASITAASIGPTTSETVREIGLDLVAEAPPEDISIKGLVGSILSYYSQLGGV